MTVSAISGILLMRHGKSDWGDDSLTDHDRPLNRRGERDVPRMAQLLIEQALIPDRIISSSAVRALTTAQKLSQELSGPEPEVHRELYLAPAFVWRRFLDAAPKTGLSLWVGHNPGLEEFIAVSTGQLVPMGTATIAWLQWQEDGNYSFKLANVWRPKEL